MKRSAFAKIYETEEYGQILVQKDNASGGNEVTVAIADAEGNLLESKISAKSKEEMMATFDAITESFAKEVVAHILSRTK